MAIAIQEPARRIRRAFRSRLASMPGAEGPWKMYRPLPIYTLDAELLAEPEDVLSKAELIGWRFVIVGASGSLSCIDINLLDQGRVGTGVVVSGTAERLFEAARLAESTAEDREYWARVLDLGYVGEEHVWLDADGMKDDIFVSVLTTKVESSETLLGRAAAKARSLVQPVSLGTVMTDLAGGGR